MKPNGVVYFKGLNGFRAIASLIVIIWHVDQYCYLFNLKSKGFCLNGMSSRAVDLFFVLSGFLITYLLLEEKQKLGKIDFKKFYFRRILRIWPPYYLAILITLFLYFFNWVEWNKTFSIGIILYFFLLANVAFSTGYDIKSITPLWSVGVEEQFYAFWPYLLDRFKRLEIIFIVLFFLGGLVRVFFYYYFLYFNNTSDFLHFLYHFKINIMSLGAVGALWYHKNSRFLKLIYRKEIQVVSWLVLIVSVLYKPLHVRSYIDAELNSIFYLILILNVATNKKTIINLEKFVFNFIGKISYGIYVYHMLIVYIYSNLFKKIGVEVINYFVLQFIILSSTIIVSYLSYIYFEGYFLKIKNKYVRIKSSNVNKNDETLLYS